jgi:hypothetical protein
VSSGAAKRRICCCRKRAGGGDTTVRRCDENFRCPTAVVIHGAWSSVCNLLPGASRAETPSNFSIVAQRVSQSEDGRTSCTYVGQTDSSFQIINTDADGQSSTCVGYVRAEVTVAACASGRFDWIPITPECTFQAQPRAAFSRAFGTCGDCGLHTVAQGQLKWLGAREVPLALLTESQWYGSQCCGFTPSSPTDNYCWLCNLDPTNICDGCNSCEFENMASATLYAD